MRIFITGANGFIGGAPYVSTSAESLGFGLHLVDWNLPMEDLIDIVALQTGSVPTVH